MIDTEIQTASPPEEIAASATVPVHKLSANVTRSGWTLFSLICIVFLIMGWLLINDLSVYTPDSARYLIWAKSIANGEGYIDRTTPEAKRYVVHGPLYSALLVPLVKFLPDAAFFTAKFFTLACGVLLLWLVFRWLLLKLERQWALTGTLLLAFHPYVLLYSTEILSDIPFVACLIGFLLLAEHIGSSRNSTTLSILGLGLIAGAGILIRELGFVFVLGGIYLFLARKERLAAVMVGIIGLAPYLLWQLRNYLIAIVEEPSLTNFALFTENVFTPQGAFFLDEYWARISSNAVVYGKAMPGFLFFPTFTGTQSLLVSPQQSGILWLSGIMDVAAIVLGIFTVVCVLLGLREDIRSSTAGKLRLVVLISYLTIILIYPINDKRFLLPVLFFMVYYFLRVLPLVLERVSLYQKNLSSKSLATGMLGVLAVASVPNISWDLTWVSNNQQYQASPVTYMNSILENDHYPWHYTKAFRQVGDWLEKNADRSSVILGQWKDLSHWIGPRKLVVADQTLALDQLEQLVRDYKVQYLVSLENKSKSQEYELQRCLSTRYNFKPVYRVGNAYIYEILSNEKNDVGERVSVSAIGQALQQLAGGRYEQAEYLLSNLPSEHRRNMTTQYYLALSKTFVGKLDEADSIFASLREFGQAGMYLDQVKRHSMMLSILRGAETIAKTSADPFVQAAVGYWTLGFRSFGRELIQRSLARDSTYLPALVFGMHFALQDLNVPVIQSFAQRIALYHPDHPLIPLVNQTLHDLDSLKMTDSPQRKTEIFLSLARQSRKMGVLESSIDFAKRATLIDPADETAAMELAEYYSLKNRHLPALTAYEGAINLGSPVTSIAKEQMEHHRRVLYLAGN